MKAKQFPALLPTLLLSLAPVATAQAGTGGFNAGDLYLQTTTWSGISSGDGAVVKIDPLSGVTTLFHDLQTGANGFQPLCYDPWRDRVLFFGGFVGNSIELWASDAAGNLQSLGMQTAAGGTRGLLTPRGDGIVYLLNPLNTGVLSYLDANDQVQVLMDASGTSAYQFPIFVVQIQNMLYVPKTNSLVITLWGSSIPCPGMPFDDTAIHVLDLSADGTRVVSETCFVYDSNPASVDGQTRGLSLGPNGDPILVIGNGGDDDSPQGRIATIDLATNTASAYATTNFFAMHRIVGGVYSNARNQVVIHDSFKDNLRAYSQGDSGGGTEYSGGLSASGSSGEMAALIEVSPLAPLGSLTADTPTASIAALGTQNLLLNAGVGFAGELYLALGSLSGWAPGTNYGGVNVPLNSDAYLALLLNNPNQVPLLNSFGTLDGAGQATITFQVPPPANPAWAGIVLHHAAVVLNAGLTVDLATNPVAVTLVP